MMTKHTPGPWKVSASTAKGRHCIDGDGLHKVPIATIEYQPENTSMYNARLIAAAPDLLAALEGAEEFVDRHSEEWYASGQRLLAEIREAIQRAKGE